MFKLFKKDKGKKLTEQDKFSALKGKLVHGDFTS
jgi:hypothetical protein